MSSDSIRTVLDWLDGKKTFIVAAIAILYIFGGDQGWWALNDSILGILGFGGLVALRTGIKRDTESLMKVLVLGLAIATVGVGCSGTALYKTVSATESAVNQAMLAWADYVAVAENTEGTDAAELLRQEGRVKAAYEGYRAGMNLVYTTRKAVVRASKVGSDAEQESAQFEYEAAMDAARKAGESLADLINLIILKTT